MNPTAVSANSLFQAFRATLDLQWVAGLDAPERQFHESAVRTADSGSDLVDYLNYIHPYRLQVLGEREIAYLASAPDAESMQRRVHRLIELEPPAIIVADAQQPLPCLLEMADKFHIPLFVATERAALVIDTLRAYLSRHFAEHTP